MGRPKVSKKNKELILSRQNNRCGHCHKELIPMTTHFDHLHPQSEEGDNDPRNLQALCSGCHDIKSRTETQARANKQRIEKKKRRDDPLGIGKLRTAKPIRKPKWMP